MASTNCTVSNAHTMLSANMSQCPLLFVSNYSIQWPAPGAQYPMLKLSVQCQHEAVPTVHNAHDPVTVPILQVKLCRT